MNVFVYRAALWCGPCVIKALIAAGKAAPAEALRRIVESNGFNFDNESDWDSDDLPKGPYPDGGGEADTPQHCDECGCFLENPLTNDGYDYVCEQAQMIFEQGYAPSQSMMRWVTFYDLHVAPGFQIQAS